MKQLVFIGFISLLFAACGSESFTEVESARAPLFPGYESYASPEEVIPRLPPELDKKVVEETSMARDPSDPPYRIYTLRIAPYAHL
ncbi:MAG: hypothetical protein ACREQV_17670, partial [Candidatus Binatia bacterium]